MDRLIGDSNKELEARRKVEEVAFQYFREYAYRVEMIGRKSGEKSKPDDRKGGG